jgi:hypothetical protein
VPAGSGYLPAVGLLGIPQVNYLERIEAFGKVSQHFDQHFAAHAVRAKDVADGDETGLRRIDRFA